MKVRPGKSSLLNAHVFRYICTHCAVYKNCYFPANVWSRQGAEAVGFRMQSCSVVSSRKRPIIYCHAQCFLWTKMASKRKMQNDDDSQPKVKRAACFKADYTKDWPFLKPGKKGETFTYCKTCACDFSVRSGGKDDCRHHVETDRHKQNDSVLQEQKKKKNNTKISTLVLSL